MFRLLMRKNKNKEDLELYQLVGINNFNPKSLRKEAKHPADIQSKRKVLNKFQGSFREDLPSGFMPKKKASTCNISFSNIKRPHRPLVQVTTARLLATS